MRDDEDYIDDDSADRQDDAPARGWRPAVAATVSLGLLGGLVVWTYQLGARDAADVPVIRAMAGELRMRPEDPGGARFDHQDRAVYAVIDGRMQPAPGAPPPEPESLTDEDLPAGRLVAETELPEGARSFDDPVTLLAETNDAALPNSALRAQAPTETLAPAPVAAAPALGTSEVDLLVAMVLDEQPAAPTSDANAGAWAPRVAPPAPPRPGLRPVAVSAEPSEAAVIAAAAPAETPRPTLAASPAAVQQTPAGPQLQLGAYLSAEDAQRMWAAIKARNGDLMAGRQVAIAPIEREGQRLWLLRAGGFERNADASALCGALQARGEECFVVRGG